MAFWGQNRCQMSQHYALVNPCGSMSVDLSFRDLWKLNVHGCCKTISHWQINFKIYSNTCLANVRNSTLYTVFCLPTDSGLSSILRAGGSKLKGLYNLSQKVMGPKKIGWKNDMDSYVEALFASVLSHWPFCGVLKKPCAQKVLVNGTKPLTLT